MSLEHKNVEYNPAVCNIGTEEIKRRYRIGYTGLFASAFLILIIELVDANAIWKLLLFIPAFYSISGFIQAKKKFCYVYGYKGVTSLAGRKKFKRVESQYLPDEKKTAIRMVTFIAFCSAVVTAAYYFLTA